MDHLNGQILFALVRDDEMNLYVAIESKAYENQNEWFKVEPDEKLILDLRKFLKRLKENPVEVHMALLEIEGDWEAMQGCTAEELEDSNKYPFEKVMARIANDRKHAKIMARIANSRKKTEVRNRIIDGRKKQWNKKARILSDKD